MVDGLREHRIVVQVHAGEYRTMNRWDGESAGKLPGGLENTGAHHA